MLDEAKNPQPIVEPESDPKWPVENKQTWWYQNKTEAEEQWIFIKSDNERVMLFQNKIKSWNVSGIHFEIYHVILQTCLYIFTCYFRAHPSATGIIQWNDWSHNFLSSFGHICSPSMKTTLGWDYVRQWWGRHYF